MTERSFPMGGAVTIDELAADPHAVLCRLRTHEPVSWVPALDGWLVTRRDLCIEVMRDARTFTVDDPRFSTQQVIGPSMLSLDGAEHRRHREPFAPAFASESVGAGLSDWVASRAATLVEGIAPAGHGDLRAAVAAPLAVDVMLRILDLGDVDGRDLLGWYDEIVAAVHAVTEGEPVPPAGRTAFEDLGAAVADHLTRSALLRATRSSGALSTEEIVANVAVLLFGGIVTAEGATATALWYLLGDEQAMAAVRLDGSLIAGAVEESLRLEPAAAVVDRYATRPARLGGASIRKGDLVRVSLTAANRDPAVFPDPDRFDLRRPNATRHVAIGRGPHACLGIHLARLQTRAAVAAAVDLLEGLHGRPDELAPPVGLVFRAPPTVTARWGGV